MNKRLILEIEIENSNNFSQGDLKKSKKKVCLCSHGVTAVPEMGEDWLFKHSGICSSSLPNPQQGLIGRARHVFLSQRHGPFEMTGHLSAVSLMARLTDGEAVFIRTSSRGVGGIEEGRG